MKQVLIVIFIAFMNYGVFAQSVIVNPDGTHSIIIDNGTTTTTIVNPNGTHSIVIDNGTTKTIVNSNGTHSIVIDKRNNKNNRKP